MEYTAVSTPVIVSLIPVISVPIWVIGVLGNVINILVFNQKDMRRSPVNLVFWWMSFGDLLELLIIVLYERSCKWCFAFDPSCSRMAYESFGWRFWASGYLLYAVHNFTLVLNITLAIMRLKVVRKPFQNRSSSDCKPVQRIVIALFILSCVLSLSILYKSTFYQDDSILSERAQLILFLVQTFETLLRLGCVIGLIISSCMLISAVIKARNDRQRKLTSDQMAETERAMKQINTLAIVIVSMFIASDIMMIVDGSILLYPFIKYFLPADFCENCFWNDTFIYVKLIIMYSQLPALLVNCSYSIFCYLMCSSQYRKTLGLYCSRFKGAESRKNIVAVPVETNV